MRAKISLILNKFSITAKVSNLSKLIHFAVLQNGSNIHPFWHFPNHALTASLAEAKDSWTCHFKIKS